MVVPPNAPAFSAKLAMIRSALWRRLVVALGLGLLCAQPAGAASPASPTAALEVFFARANAIMRTVDPMRGPDEPRHAVRELVNDVIEFRAATALALGPVWNSRPPEDQDDFVGLFAGVLEKGFVAAILTNASVSGGVRIRFLGETIVDDSASVSTTLLSRTGNQLPVDYRLVRRGERWKVQDIIIDGVSLIANYRAQFNRILRDYSYAELIARMRGEALEARPPALAAVAVPEAQKVRSDAPEMRPAAVVVAVPEAPKRRVEPIDAPRSAPAVSLPDADRLRGDFLDAPRPAVAATVPWAAQLGPSPKWVMGRDGHDAEEEMEAAGTQAVTQGRD
jgi:phospholipid transport system substrate-binding protein